MLDHSGAHPFRRIPERALLFLILLALGLLLAPAARAEEESLELQPLIDEAIRSNHEVLVKSSRIMTLTHRVPQSGALPDPMFMFGYENEGFQEYAFNQTPDARWMFSLSQMFPYPGKRALKSEMSEREVESQWESFEMARLMTAEKVKELYYDLFLAHKSIDLIKERRDLFVRVEEAALARYSAGMGSQQEVLMAQTEKYMLLEREEMLKQRIQTLEAMLNLTVGRDTDTPLGRPPAVLEPTAFSLSDGDIMKHHLNSPFIREKEKMVAAADTRVRMAEREYYPDFTLTANYFLNGEQYDDMWNLTASFNIPIYYNTKQKNAVLEARAAQSEAEHDLEGIALMLGSTLRENRAMMMSAERLMDIYRNGLIPKATQDVESAMSGYATGKTEALMVVNRLKSLVDLELLYWQQFAEREKAIARMTTVMSGAAQEAEAGVPETMEAATPKTEPPSEASKPETSGPDTSGEVK